MRYCLSVSTRLLTLVTLVRLSCNRYVSYLPADPELRTMAVNILGKFLTAADTNVR